MSARKITRVEYDLLIATLSQEGWAIERLPLSSALVKTIAISNFEINVRDTGRVILTLKLGEEKVNLEELEVARVFLQGQPGIPNEEPHRFEILLRNPSRKQRQRARTGIGYLHRFKNGAVGLVFVRDENAPPGWPMFKSSFHSNPYGFEEHIRRIGMGDNFLRTPRLAQPRALEVGDILATGDRVLSPPRQGYNSSVLIHLTGGCDGHWVRVTPRLPIALLTKEDNAPKKMWRLE